MIGQYQNLITFGCSWAFGTGVQPDQTFGAILAKELGVSFVNLAIPGSNNSRSLLELLKYSKNINLNNSIAVFLITTAVRECVITDSGSWHNIIHTGDLPIESVEAAYIKHFSSHANTMFNLYKNVSATQAACRELGIKDFYATAWNDVDFDFPGIDREKIHPTSCVRMFGYQDQHEYISKYPYPPGVPDRYTLECGHPNRDGHQLVAENLKTYILSQL